MKWFSLWFSQKQWRFEQDSCLKALFFFFRIKAMAPGWDEFPPGAFFVLGRFCRRFAALPLDIDKLEEKSW